MLTPDECHAYKRFVDKYQWYVYPLLGARICRMYGRQGGRIIDMGTGPGYLTAELAGRTGATVHAVDINPEMHALARKHLSSLGLAHLVHFDLADVNKLPYPSGFADLVVSYSCLHHWIDPVRGLAECYRVLSPGGLMVIIDTAPNPVPTLKTLRQIIAEPHYFSVVEEAIGESYHLHQVVQMASQANIPHFDVKEFQFDDEDLVECLDTLENLPVWNGDADVLCWVLQACKAEEMTDGRTERI